MLILLQGLIAVVPAIFVLSVILKVLINAYLDSKYIRDKSEEMQKHRDETANVMASKHNETVHKMETLEQEAIERGFAEKDQDTGDLIWLEVY